MLAARMPACQSFSHPLADEFVCAFCGDWRPWRLLAGWSWRRRRRLCEQCIRIMDLFELGGRR